MNILIDIVHMADVNFYKNTVEELKKKGNKVTITVLRRGRLVSVVKNEFTNCEIKVLGDHKVTFLGKIIGIVNREYLFFRLYTKNKFDVVTSFGFYPGLFAKAFGIKAVHFHDDKEYKLNYFLTKVFASQFISFCPVKETKKVHYINNFKELASLHPMRYKEDTGILKKLNIRKDKYVYVRDIKQISLNYADHKHIDYQPFFDSVTNKGYDIIYNSENETCPYKHARLIVSNYTYEEITALKKHAALVLSSGDTELREAALLGTPAIYTSNRIMEINMPLFKEGLYVTAIDSDDLCAKGIDYLKKSVKVKHQKKAKLFLSKYPDLSTIMVEVLSS